MVIRDETRSCLKVIQQIRSRISDEEYHYLYDIRTHVAHPQAAYYRLKTNDEGKLHEKTKGIEKVEIQRLLGAGVAKFRALDPTKPTAHNASLEFAKKLFDTEFDELTMSILKILSAIDHRLLVANYSIQK